MAGAIDFLSSGQRAGFGLDLRKFAEKAQGAADAAVRQTVINFANRVIERSPVGMPATWKRPAPAGYRPGQFRANWQLGLDAEPTGTIYQIDPSGMVTKDKIAASIPARAAGHVYFLTNNLPYAWPLETGWSNQAPFGMVGITAAEFGLIVSDAANDAKAVLVAAE